MGRAPPPGDLSEYWRFVRYGLPPNAGGQRDQPLGWFERGERMDEAFRDWLAWSRGDKTAKWMNANPERWGRVQRIMELMDG